MPRPNFLSLAMVLGGLLALLLGLTIVSMCDCDSTQWGALVGAIAGVVLAKRWHFRQALWTALAGALIGGSAMLLPLLSRGSEMDDLPWSLIRAVLIGGGLGLMADGIARRSDTPPSSTSSS